MLNKFAIARATESTHVGDTATANVVLTPLMDEAKVEAIKKAMQDREVFPTLADAIAKLEKAAAATDNFYGLPIQVAGTKEDGEVDETLYAGQNAALAYVGAKADTEKNKKPGIKGVVIFPVPTIDAFAESDEGKAFLNKVVQKEVALVAFRRFREAGTLYEFMSGVNAVPMNAADYATESRRGVDTDTFDIVWPHFKTALKAKMPALHDLLPAKKMFLDALRSADYAKSTPETQPLEEGGWFVKFANLLIKSAESNVNAKTNAPEPLDASAIKNWLETRDTLVLEREGPKAKDFSVLASIGSALDF